MIVALLEDRPIYVFDEWAADQDPYFRKKFYREILPMLKSKGKTVIAVTHDERYFDAADIRFHMEEGGLQRVSASAGPDGNAPPAEH
jgi:putative ATP-binding cassette transporter